MSRRPLPLRVLLVEDNPDDVEIVRALLQPVGEGTIDLRTAATRRAGEAVARSTPPDLVLLDLGLPDSSGLSTVTAWHREVHDDAPVLVVSGACEPEVRDRRRELGVVDVVDKSELVHFLELGDRGSLAFVDRLSAAAAP